MEIEYPQKLSNPKDQVEELYRWAYELTEKLNIILEKEDANG